MKGKLGEKEREFDYDKRKNKAIARRFFKALAMNDQAILSEVLAHDFMMNDPSAPGSVDREIHAQGFNRLSGAFSELRISVEDQITEGDKVATHFT